MTASDEIEISKISTDADRYLKSLDGVDSSESDKPRLETIEETRERIKASNGSSESSVSASSFEPCRDDLSREKPIPSKSVYSLLVLVLFIISLGFCFGLWYVRYLFISEARLVFASGSGLTVNAEESRVPAATVISRLSVLTTLIPWDSHAAGLKARAHVARGEFDLALEYVNRSLSRNPQNIDALFARANANHELERSSNLEHIRALTSIIKLRPDFVAAYRNRSSALQRLDRISEAIDDLSMALTLNPGVPEVLLKRASLHASNGSQSSACDDYRQFVEVEGAKSDYIDNNKLKQWAAYCW